MDRIDWMLLREISKSKSMSKAAEALFISQPAVSYRLSKMEDAYQQVLFVRTGKGVSLTDAGQRLSSFASKMLYLDDEINTIVCQNDDDCKGDIKIGTTSSVLNYYLADQIKQFSRIYSKVNIDIIVNDTVNLVNTMKNGDLLLAVLRGNDFSELGCICYAFMSEPLVIIADSPISYEYLINTPYIPYAPNSYSYAIKSQIEDWMGHYFVNGRPKLSMVSATGGSRNIVSLVKAGFGWSVISATRLHESDGLYNQVIYKQNKEDHYLFNTQLVYSSEIQYFHAYIQYINHFKSYFKEIKNRPDILKEG